MPATVIMEARAPSVNAQLRTVSYAGAMSTGRIISAGKGRPLPYAGGYAHVVAEPVEGVEGFSAVELTVPAGSAGPVPHIHDGFDEAFFILAGELALTCGDDAPIIAEAGAFCVAPRGERHTFANPSDTPARFLCLWTPGRIGLDFFAAIGEAIPPNGCPDPAIMSALFEAHQTRAVP